MDTARPVEDPLVDGYLETKLPGEMTPAEFDRWMCRGTIVEALDEVAGMAHEAGVGLGELVGCLTRRHYARLDAGWIAAAGAPSRSLAA